jgi:transglutaminase-like putative cysteine protease
LPEKLGLSRNARYGIHILSFTLPQARDQGSEVSMRLKIRHETHYSYGRPANSAVQILRLTPRSHAGQFVRRWRVEIDADCRLDRSDDAFGNITHTFTVDGPVKSMRVIAEGEVDTAGTAGFLKGTVERFPLALWLRDTALTRVEPDIRNYARLVAGSEGGDELATLHALMARIHEDFRFMVGETTAQTTAVEAFRQKSGVCQDLAHVFCACARSLGIPARYAGGYYLRTDTDQQVAGHAWAEAYLQGLGWLGFDPANGVCITARYLRVAIGQDYLDAAPIRGARIGGDDEQLTVAVEVKLGREIVDA